MSDRKPQPGDRVRITYEAEYRSDWEAVGKDGTVTYPADATVEVVEPADDPSKDQWGTVRREDPDGWLWVKTRGSDQWICINLGVDVEGDDYVAGFPITGAVPGTPAAEANDAEEQAREEAKEWRANKAEYDTSDAAFVYNSDLRADGSSVMSFHRNGGAVHIRIHHHEDDRFTFAVAVVEEHDVRKVGEALLSLTSGKRQVDSPHGWEPRVFQADGPEPPEDVKALRWTDSNPGNRWCYLIHTHSGWVWATSPDEPLSDNPGAYWRTATRACPGRYREVQP